MRTSLRTTLRRCSSSARTFSTSAGALDSGAESYHVKRSQRQEEPRKAVVDSRDTAQLLASANEALKERQQGSPAQQQDRRPRRDAAGGSKYGARIMEARAQVPTQSSLASLLAARRQSPTGGDSGQFDLDAQRILSVDSERAARAAARRQGGSGSSRPGPRDVARATATAQQEGVRGGRHSRAASQTEMLSLDDAMMNAGPAASSPQQRNRRARSEGAGQRRRDQGGAQPRSSFGGPQGGFRGGLQGGARGGPQGGARGGHRSSQPRRDRRQEPRGSKGTVEDTRPKVRIPAPERISTDYSITLADLRIPADTKAAEAAEIADLYKGDVSPQILHAAQIAFRNPTFGEGRRKELVETLTRELS